MSLPNPSEFQSVDGFYAPQEAGLLFSIPPVLVATLVLLLVLAGLLGWWLGRRKQADADPGQAIYDAIRKAVSGTAGAPRDSVAVTARHLKTVIEDRLGAVRRLGHGLDSPYAALDRALEGYGETGDPHGPEDGKDEPPLLGARKVTINARNVVLNTGHSAETPPHAGHGGDHGGDHGDHAHDDHAPRKRLDAPAQTAAIRTAVHAFSDYWSDKPARLKDLREARRQLTTLPPGARPGH